MPQTAEHLFRCASTRLSISISIHTNVVQITLTHEQFRDVILSALRQGAKGGKARKSKNSFDN